MVYICPICGSTHKYDNIECLRRRDLPDGGRLDDLEDRIRELEKEKKSK